MAVQFVNIVSLASLFTPVMIGVHNWLRYSKALRFFVVLSIYSFIISVTFEIMPLFNIPNIWFAHYGEPAEFLTIAFFYFLIARDTTMRYVVLASVLFFILFFTASKFTFEPFGGFYIYGRVVQTFFYLLFGLTSLTQLLNASPVFPRSSPYLWINIGMIIYGMANFYYVLLFKYWITKVPSLLEIYVLNNFTMSVFFSIGLLCKSQE